MAVMEKDIQSQFALATQHLEAIHVPDIQKATLRQLMDTLLDRKK